MGTEKVKIYYKSDVPTIPPTLPTPPSLLYTSELIAIATFYAAHEIDGTLRTPYATMTYSLTTAITIVL
jgi:hypothetical protein